MRSRYPLLVVLAGVALAAAGSAQQQPVFRSGADIIPIDVTVLDGRGQPIRDLTAADFTVRVDGRPRRVSSVDWISLTSPGAPRSAAPVPEGYVSNAQATGGRLIVLAIDQPNIPFTAVRPMQDTLFRFIDQLEPSDRLAVIGFGSAAPSISFTTDRNAARQALTRMPGQQSDDSGRHSVGLSMALTIDRFALQNEADRCIPRCANQTLDQLVGRDCPNDPNRPDQRAVCKNEILAEAHTLVQNARQEGDVTIRSMQSLLTALKGVDAPKTLILVSQRFFMDTERDGADRVTALGNLAAAARTTIYGVRLQEDAFNITQGIQSLAAAQDRQLNQVGLQAITGAARGTLLNVTGTGAGVFERIAAELSGYYLLGVEPLDGDRDGKSHPLTVDVTRSGVAVRARRTMLAASAGDAAAASSRDSATAALAEPFLLTAIPLRGIAFALRGPDRSKLQLLVHVDIGSSYTAPTRLAVAHAVLDRNGRALDGQVTDVRLAPVTPGVPSSIEYVIGASVDPGEYTIKVAVVDGDRAGTIELPAHAGLLDVGAMTVTDLIVGGPVPPGDPLRPSISPRAAFGSVQGYLEAYGNDVASLTARFEVTSGQGAAPVLTADVPPRAAGDDRAIFSQIFTIGSLPPGDYQLRAVINKGDAVVKTLARSFEIPAAAGASASGAIASKDLALAVDPKDLMPAFRRDAALRPATIAPFRDRLNAAAKPAFEQGLASMQKSAYADAEKSFRFALQQDPGSAAALAYLAACLAAAGYDTQAAAAWQTALARGTDLPQIHEWLGESLMRDGLFNDARGIFEDAIEQFPREVRFNRSLALVYATSGRGRDAVKTMERFLAATTDDPRAVYLAMQWLFNLHRAGIIVHGKMEDLQLARDYAARYTKANAPDQPLVKQWLDFLEKDSK